MLDPFGHHLMGYGPLVQGGQGRDQHSTKTDAIIAAFVLVGTPIALFTAIAIVRIIEWLVK